MRRTEDLTAEHDKARLNVCLCYNSKHEVLNAFEKTAELHSLGKLPSQTGMTPKQQAAQLPTIKEFES